MTLSARNDTAFIYHFPVLYEKCLESLPSRDLVIWVHFRQNYDQTKIGAVILPRYGFRPASQACVNHVVRKIIGVMRKRYKQYTHNESLVA